MKKRILPILLLTLMPTRTKAQEKRTDPARSHTLVHFLPGDLQNSELENLTGADLSSGMFKLSSQGPKPVSAVLTSPALRALFPFDQLLLTADATLGPEDELSCQGQVQTSAGWSPWFDFGSFKLNGGAASVKDQANAFGRMEIDTLILQDKALSFRYRIKLSAKPDSTVHLKLISAVYTDTTLPYQEPAALKTSATEKPVKLDVPQYSQMMEQVNYSKDICSPTSLSMTLNYFGVRSTPLGTAAAVLDNTENIYGNWAFNTQYAGTKSLYSWLVRINSMSEARSYLAAGIPLIASIAFGADELKKAPLKKTRGHLVLVKGFTAGGGVLVNDPAAPDSKTVERVYDRKEFARAWLKNKYGTAYAITPVINTFLTVKPPFAEVFSMPVDPVKDDRTKLMETQLLPGERIKLIEASGGWLKIEALEQAHKASRDAKKLTPYTGWIEAKNAVFFLPQEPDAVIKVKNAGRQNSEYGGLSIGTRLKILGKGSGSELKVLLPGGAVGFVSEKDINPLPVKLKKEELGKKIVATARQFTGDKYYWGGRSGSGIDCSGLVNMAYRVWGIDLPRNAEDQFAAAKTAARESLEPGDLIFSTEPGNRKKIDHVMLYCGAGKIIEATKDTNSVREIGFKEKFGLELAKVKNGQTVNGKTVFFRKAL